MTVNAPKTRRLRTRFAKYEIPKALIYEEYEGKPIYYKGFLEVMNHIKTFEEIMGESHIQAIMVSCLIEFLLDNINRKKFIVSTNEVGLHLKKSNNLSSDIVIYDRELFTSLPVSKKYLTKPPLTVIEIDIKADTEAFGMSEVDYYSMKTKRLLEFGVKELVWFFTANQQQMVARPGQDWVISDWDKTITILDEYSFSMKGLLDQNGFKL
ncbi:MAG: Uma2 family endonuclease [Runella sp.]